MDTGICIKAMGVVCAIGNSPDEVLTSLRRQRSGIFPAKYLRTKHSELPVGEVKLSNEQLRARLGTDDSTASRTALLGALALRQALEDYRGRNGSKAGLECLDGKRAVLVSGTTVGNMDVNEWTDSSGGNDCAACTADIARLALIPGVECCTVSTACSAALNAIMTGCEMLLTGRADIVFAGGTEALSRYHLNGFNSLMILDSERCRPFDASRAGLNLGEGAGYLVLERATPEDSEASDGAPAVWIRGYANRCDAFHQTASSPEGEGAFLAMRDALAMASLKASDIRYVNAHGTGTVNNDESESHAIARLFSDKIPCISSTKGFTGHTTSASGAIEAVICCLALRSGFLPGNIALRKPICDGLIPEEGLEVKDLKNVMCNAFGFGGNDSSLILSSDWGPLPFSGTEVCGTSISGEALDVGLIREASCTTIDSPAQLPALKDYLPPLHTRRMCSVMKAALLASILSLQKAGISCPGAVIATTPKGMVEMSRLFLAEIEAGGEQTLKPTCFMQSTQNTIASAAALHYGSHGYNITYSQQDEEWAMEDAVRQLLRGKAGSVLVLFFDESAPAGDNSAATFICRSKVLTLKQ